MKLKTYAYWVLGLTVGLLLFGGDWNKLQPGFWVGVGCYVLALAIEEVKQPAAVESVDEHANRAIEIAAPDPAPPYPADLYPGCPCYACDSPNWETAGGVTFARMCLCPRCGSKRCEGAVDHTNQCTPVVEIGARLVKKQDGAS
jgi:hypothetical protein